MGFEDPQQAFTKSWFHPVWLFFGGWGEEEADLWKPKTLQDLELEISHLGNISIDLVRKSVESSGVRFKRI